MGRLSWWVKETVRNSGERREREETKERERVGEEPAGEKEAVKDAEGRNGGGFGISVSTARLHTSDVLEGERLQPSRPIAASHRGMQG